MARLKLSLSITALALSAHWPSLSNLLRPTASASQPTTWIPIIAALSYRWFKNSTRSMKTCTHIKGCYLILSRPYTLDKREKECAARERELEEIQLSTAPHQNMDKPQLLLVLQSKCRAIKSLRRQNEHLKTRLEPLKDARIQANFKGMTALYQTHLVSSDCDVISKVILQRKSE